MAKETKINATPNPEYKPDSPNSIIFDKSQYPATGTYDPIFGIKTGRGMKGFASMICWLSKDKMTFHVKFNIGPYDWLSI